MGKRRKPDKGSRHKRKARAKAKVLPTEPVLSEMEGRGRKRMPTMAERDERDRDALERLRRLNQQEW